MTAIMSKPPVAQRIEALDWPTLTDELDEFGWAGTAPLLGLDQCAEFTPIR